MAGNSLYYGGNLDILRHRIESDSVDLVYLDPPFNSNADYNVIFREQSGEKSAAPGAVPAGGARAIASRRHHPRSVGNRRRHGSRGHGERVTGRRRGGVSMPVVKEPAGYQVLATYGRMRYDGDDPPVGSLAGRSAAFGRRLHFLGICR